MKFGKEDLRNAIALFLGKSRKQVTDCMTITEELLETVEDHLEIIIPTWDFRALETVGDLMEYVEDME